MSEIISIQVNSFRSKEVYAVGEYIDHISPKDIEALPTECSELLPTEIKIGKIIKREKVISQKISKGPNIVSEETTLSCYCVCDESGHLLIEINEGTNIIISYERKD